ncbi:uncharacterized protein LOC122974019 [Thunnus albacares]|uniref:uncharacterized protein LOC122974019 n=1 Tax=Thunnus albacares TaxID=8236 RepID=UPI001CF70526|nr:uncharacterized protein LOC122974019 [Thunnus albacares]
MANLWWITVTLTFFLSAGCLAEVDQNKLATLIQKIRNITGNQITGVYSVAVSMPKDDPYNPQKVPQLTEDNIKQIREAGLYKTDRLVFALKLNHSRIHAESRLLTNLSLVNEEGDMLVIFASDSPCNDHCANPNGPYNILNRTEAVIKGGKWGNHVFVFEKVFKPNKGGKNIAEGKLKEALRNIGNYIGGLANVFRCYKPQNAGFQCVSCSSGGEVTEQCVDYDA